MSALLDRFGDDLLAKRIEAERKRAALEIISLYTSFFINKINDLQLTSLGRPRHGMSGESVRLIQNIRTLPCF